MGVRVYSFSFPGNRRLLRHNLKNMRVERDFSSETSPRAAEAGFIAKPVSPVNKKTEEQYVR